MYKYSYCECEKYIFIFLVDFIEMDIKCIKYVVMEDLLGVENIDDKELK